MYLDTRKKRESGRDYALRVLKENIVRLELAPGSRVSENELAMQLGLSRTPVREALIELAEVRMIEVLPQRGSFVSKIDYDLVEQAHFMRDTLECAMVERLCQMDIEPGPLALLEENLYLQEMKEKTRAHDFMALDDAFHHQLFIAAGLPQVHKLMDSMTVHFDRVRAMALVAVKELKLAQDHRAILTAISQRDAATAKALMHKHLNRYQVDQESIREKYPQYCQ